MTTDDTPADLARKVIKRTPDGTIDQWGTQLDKMIDKADEGYLNEWRLGAVRQTLGRFVKATKARLEADQGPKVSHDGKPLGMTPTLSVRTEKGRQLKLWTECSPDQFIEAVIREQRTVDGRHNSNALRMQVVELLEKRDDLRSMETLAVVLDAIGQDPAELKLDELPSDEATG